MKHPRERTCITIDIILTEKLPAEHNEGVIWELRSEIKNLFDKSIIGADKVQVVAFRDVSQRKYTDIELECMRHLGEKPLNKGGTYGTPTSA